MISSVLRLVALGLLLYASASLSQVVFKWTDENGEVHYGETVPPGIANFERLTITPGPAPVPARQQPQATERSEPERAAPSRPTPAAAEPPPATAISVEELDRLCEAAREREIAPLRAAAIAECKENPRTDPAYCERFYSDFGDAGLTQSGAVRPRLYNDLPECVQADEARRRSPRR